MIYYFAYGFLVDICLIFSVSQLEKQNYAWHSYQSYGINSHIKQNYLLVYARISTHWTHGVNWTYIRCSEDFLCVLSTFNFRHVSRGYISKTITDCKTPDKESAYYFGLSIDLENLAFQVEGLRTAMAKN